MVIIFHAKNAKKVGSFGTARAGDSPVVGSSDARGRGNRWGNFGDSFSN